MLKLLPPAENENPRLSRKGAEENRRLSLEPKVPLAKSDIGAPEKLPNASVPEILVIRKVPFDWGMAANVPLARGEPPPNAFVNEN